MKRTELAPTGSQMTLLQRRKKFRYEGLTRYKTMNRWMGVLTDVVSTGERSVTMKARAAQSDMMMIPLLMLLSEEPKSSSYVGFCRLKKISFLGYKYKVQGTKKHSFVCFNYRVGRAEPIIPHHVRVSHHLNTQGKNWEGVGWTPHLRRAGTCLSPETEEDGQGPHLNE